MRIRKRVHPMRAMRFKDQRRTLSARTNALLSRSNEVHCRATPQFFCFFFFFISPSFPFDSDAMIMSDALFRKLIQLRTYRRSDGRMWGRDKASLIDLLAASTDRWGAKAISRRIRSDRVWEVYITQCLSLATFLSLNEFIYKRMAVAPRLLRTSGAK